MARDDFESAEFGDSQRRGQVARVSPIRQPLGDDLPPADGDPNWWSLRTAAEKTGVPLATIRGWYRRGRVTSRKVLGAHGPQVEVLAGDVDALASLRTGPQPSAGRPTPSEAPRVGPEPSQVAPPTPPPPPEGSVLIPIDSWQKMLTQLGNLHEAGQQLAEARERAAKAETESLFLRERIADMRQRIAHVEGSEPSPARPTEQLAEREVEEAEPGVTESPRPRAVVARVARAVWRAARRA